MAADPLAALILWALLVEIKLTQIKRIGSQVMVDAVASALSDWLKALGNPGASGNSRLCYLPMHQVPAKTDAASQRAIAPS
jgi:hypothetical protein